MVRLHGSRAWRSLQADLVFFRVLAMWWLPSAREPDDCVLDLALAPRNNAMRVLPSLDVFAGHGRKAFGESGMACLRDFMGHC